VATIATAATAVETVILGGGAFLLAKQPWAVRPPSDGSRFAGLPDLKKAGLLDGKPGHSILLGTFGKGRQAVEVRYSGDSHFFVNGPSRSGKGRGFVMTNLLEYQGSAIVLDVKLENWEKTGPARLAMGQKCYVFAPGSKHTHRWNPLDFVRDWPERSTDLINLSASLIPLGEKEDPYWKQTARGLFAGVLGYVLESTTMEGRRNLRSALRLFSTGNSFSAVIAHILKHEPDLNGFIVDSFRQHLGRDEEQRPSFEGHITTSLSPFNNLLMAEAASASDFDIREMRRNPFSLFIASPVSDFGTVEPIIRLLIQQIHDVMLRKLPGKDEPYKILMMLDEFYQFERLPEIIKRAPLVAGYGMTIALVAQNIPQIDERYGVKTRDALLGNMDVKLNIAVGDDTTARIVSGNLGRQYVEREGWGRGGGLLMSKQASQGRFELIPLMDPDAVLRLDDRSTILQIRGTYGAILNKLNFYEDPMFFDRRREAAVHAARMPQPVITLTPEWPLFEERPSSPPAAEASEAVPVPPLSPHRVAAPVHDERSMDDDAAVVLEKARAVYRNPERFAQMFRDAVVSWDNDASAQLLHNLRLAPDQYGPLIGDAGPLNIKGWLTRKRALAAIGPLRAAVIKARRRVIEERASLYAAGQRQARLQPEPALATTAINPSIVAIQQPNAENTATAPQPIGSAEPPAIIAGSVSPVVATAPVYADDDEDAFADRELVRDEAEHLPAESVVNDADLADDEEDDDNRIDFGLADVAANVGAVALLAQDAIGSGQARNINALSGALSRINASLTIVTSDEPWSVASLKLNQMENRHVR
jgi:type IV secretion system protein VirD4